MVLIYTAPADVPRMAVSRIHPGPCTGVPHHWHQLTETMHGIQFHARPNLSNCHQAGMHALPYIKPQHSYQFVIRRGPVERVLTPTLSPMQCIRTHT